MKLEAAAAAVLDSTNHKLISQKVLLARLMNTNSKLISLSFLIFLIPFSLFYIANYSHLTSPNPTSTTTTAANFKQTLHTVQQIPPTASETVVIVPIIPPPEPTSLKHIVFGIATSAKHWQQRKDYIKFWYNHHTTRGHLFVDTKLPIPEEEAKHYPSQVISADTSRFGYTHRRGTRSGLRITRIVSEIVRMGLDEVRWYVMADDDTVFVPENLVRVLRKYNHSQMYYVGANSETHLQNIRFSYGMAYGGGGFAISAPLAKAVEKMQDRCMVRYEGLYGSDDRIHACLAELGVPLTKEPGFHQFDLFGSLLGILSTHPLTPLVTMHHIDILDPIFPGTTRSESIHRLKVPSELDPASLMQQSICYDSARNWTISVSWGYTVIIYRGRILPRDMEQPPRTFLNWYKRDDQAGFAFNTRPISKHPCQKPYVHYFTAVSEDRGRRGRDQNGTVSLYELRKEDFHPWCWWDMVDPLIVKMVEVRKKTDPKRWEKAPRRDCCRVLTSKEDSKMVIDVGDCKEGETIEPITTTLPNNPKTSSLSGQL